jgi:hypothetical protein
MKVSTAMLWGEAAFFAVFTSLSATIVATTASDVGSSGGVLQKVVELLTSLDMKVKKEKSDEEIAFAKFKTWCSHEIANVGNGIAADAQAIEGLSADVAQLDSNIEELGRSIGQLESDVAGFQSAKTSATKQRTQDHAEFATESADYSDSVDALDQALLTLKKQDYDRGTGSSLLQVVHGQAIPERAKAILTAFAGTIDDGDQNGLAYQAPKANAYEFQSGGIVSLLEKLKDEFRDKLTQCQKEEMNSKHAYNMIVQDFTDSIANANDEIERKSQDKARKGNKRTQDKKELHSKKATKLASETRLVDLNSECTEKRLSYEEKQQLRAEEIEAIAQAIEILSSPAAKGVGEKYLSLSQKRSTDTALIQHKEGRHGKPTEIRRRLRAFFRSESVRLQSQRLNLLGEKIESQPFANVKKLIESLITRLLEEANQDADHEGFCDSEIGKSKITRNKLSEDIDALAAAVEEGKAAITSLTQSVADLAVDVADLDKALAEGAELRASEKTENSLTVQEAKEAQAAVLRAMAVLKEFYTKALTTTAFLQTHSANDKALLSAASNGVPMGSAEWNSLANPAFEGNGGYAAGTASDKVDKGHKAGMQTFGARYQGQQEESGGVLALLEVVLSDFAALEADTSASEVASAKAHAEFTRVTKIDRATKQKQIEMDNADKSKLDAELREDTADLKSKQDQLLAADRYYEKLVPQCIDPGVTFEERANARKAEITSLKEALQILKHGVTDTLVS